MKTVREYYKFREELKEALQKDPNESLYDELRVVEEYIAKIEAKEIEELNKKQKI